MQILQFPTKPNHELAEEAREFADKCLTDFAEMRTAIVILSGKGIQMVCLGEAPDALSAIGMFETAKMTMVNQILE